MPVRFLLAKSDYKTISVFSRMIEYIASQFVKGKEKVDFSENLVISVKTPFLPTC